MNTLNPEEDKALQQYLDQWLFIKETKQINEPEETDAIMVSPEDWKNWTEEPQPA